ncbi:hypothetical protein SCITRI_00403 [Spiroplasma citri]|nr:hypothetical protein SCITRI_00403 [Spiroplasma citri]
MQKNIENEESRLTGSLIGNGQIDNFCKDCFELRRKWYWIIVGISIIVLLLLIILSIHKII